MGLKTDPLPFGRVVLHAVDISSPAAPASRGTIQTGGEIHDLHVANGLVYAVGRAGLTIMPTACETVTSVTSLSAPPRPLRVRVHPSPFSAGTTFEITEAASGTVRVEIFDASGRCVRVIDAERGDSRVDWNGADARGRVLAPGIYFASVSAGSLTSTVRVVKLP